MKKFQIMNGRSASLPHGMKRERERVERREAGETVSQQLLGIYRPFANPNSTQLAAIAENLNRKRLTYAVFY